jgi:hypothetical protein
MAGLLVFCLEAGVQTSGMEVFSNLKTITVQSSFTCWNRATGDYTDIQTDLEETYPERSMILVSSSQS